ncbi:class I SAM-dependent methyltransferase [Herbivorax sp. ANBcel31]|uniref:class I SAM-dependent methyltransferase n=1 Tax=Herbivorax sp. ANBcel31 TaxID=3069754 RepID=UPI0027B43407|nr:class I SAM-dependent methyltransferase [Herbivorax sp. ANBcel31]MDQ2087135.1 class I SAM-dependent methyltransferase [Herbivorax sp. ANBcel31]
MKSLTYIGLLSKYKIGGAHPGGLPLTKELLKSLYINKNTNLLDVGCGTGQTAAHISKTYKCKVTAIDIDNKMLEIADERFRKENLGIKLLREDASNMKFLSNTFDIVLSESVTVFTDIKKSIKEYFRVIKEGGTLVAIEITAQSNLSENDLKKIKSVYGIENIPDLQEWTDIFLEAGFKDVKSYKIKSRPTCRLRSFKMLRDFSPHLNFIRCFYKKVGYRIYICK